MSDCWSASQTTVATLDHDVEGSAISEALVEELADLRDVWESMAKPYKTLEEELKQTVSRFFHLPKSARSASLA